MAMKISESDRIAYDELECKNITLETFVIKRLKETLEIERANIVYRKSVNPSTKPKPLFNNVSNLACDTGKCVARTIVIDGANIMHGGSPYRDTREGGHEFIPDVAALLSVMRFFLKRGFEVFAVVSRKYMKPTATNFKEAIDELVKNHLCVVVPHTNLDDSVALEFAAQINGVVLTADLYRDHASECSRSRRIVKDHRLGVEWGSHRKDGHTRVIYPHDDYVPAKDLFFISEDGREMSEEEVIKRVYAFPEQLQYTISKERREMANPDRKKNKVVAFIEDLIARGLSVYKENVKTIINTPLHVPNEASSNSLTDLDDTLLEVPEDVQAEYIDQNPEGFQSDDEW